MLSHKLCLVRLLYDKDAKLVVEESDNLKLEEESGEDMHA